MAWTKILCAVDFSTCSHVALERAAFLAASSKAALVIAHVHAPAARPAPLTAEPVLWTPAGAVEEANRELEPKMAQLQTEAEAIAGRGNVETRLLEGDAAAEISRLARDGRYDLLVLGTHGRTGLKRLVLGSVAEHVVRTSPVSVLVVREAPCFEFAAED